MPKRCFLTVYDFYRSFLSCIPALGNVLVPLRRWPGSVTDGFGDDADDSAGGGQAFEPMRSDNNDNSEESTVAVDFRRSQPGSA